MLGGTRSRIFAAVATLAVLGIGVDSPSAGAAPPPITGIGYSFAGTEGRSLSPTVATFTDPVLPATSYTAVIDWGDGLSSEGTVSPQLDGTIDVGGAHSYCTAGDFAVTTTLTQIGTARSATTSATARMADAALAPLASTADVRSQEGQRISPITGRFRDPNLCATVGDFTATVDWGDGGTSDGRVLDDSPPARSSHDDDDDDDDAPPQASFRQFQVIASHSYRDEGTYTITTFITDREGSATATRQNVVVVDAPLHAQPALTPLTNGTEPGTISPGSPSSGELASFTDENPFAGRSDFRALVDWGDGSAATGGAISGPDGPSGGPWTVTGSHQYLDDGSFTIRITILDDGGSSATTTTTAIVSRPTNPIDLLIDLLTD